MNTKVATAQPEIEIQQIGAATMRVPVIGTSPLIVHRFSEKAKKIMLDRMQGKKSPKQPKDPQAEFEAAAYRFDDDRYGLPSVAFKAATVSAARLYDSSVTMVGLRQSLFFGGEVGKDGQLLVEIESGPPRMREDVVRVSRGGSDLRYRPEFWPWSAVLKVTYIQSMLTRDSVLSLIDAGGMSVGVGEWRPEKRGDFGCFQIDQSRKVEVAS